MTGPSITRSFFLILFATLVTLPPLQMIFQPFEIARLDERRRGFELHDATSRLLHLDPSLAQDLNAWFDDHIGFRDSLIRIKNEMDYRLFRTSQKILIGQDSWLFHRNHATAQVLLQRMDDSHFQQVKLKIDKLADFLKIRGIRLIVVGNPLKSAVYPEKLPINFPHLPTPRRFEELSGYLRSRSDLYYIDGEEILKLHKGGRPLYYKTDLHINYWGTALIVAEVVKRMETAEKMKPSSWQPAPPSSLIPFENGDEARFLSKLEPVHETIDVPIHMHSLFVDTDQGYWLRDHRPKIRYERWGAQPIFDWAYRSRPNSALGLLPPAVLFGNSFSDPYWSNGLHTLFAELYRTGNAPERLESLLLNLPPQTRWFVWQFFEPDISEILQWKIPAGEINTLATAGDASNGGQILIPEGAQVDVNAAPVSTELNNVTSTMSTRDINQIWENSPNHSNGKIVNHLEQEYKTSPEFEQTLPLRGGIPKIDMGAAIMGRDFQPTSADNLIMVHVSCAARAIAGKNQFVIALYRNQGPVAVRAATAVVPAGKIAKVDLFYQTLAGSTSPQSLQVRVGVGNEGKLLLNPSPTENSCKLSIKEVAPRKWFIWTFY